MCIAAPGKVIKVEGRKVLVDYWGEIRQAFLGNEPVKVGDYVMVQMGVVIRIVNEKEAKIALDAWKDS